MNGTAGRWLGVVLVVVACLSGISATAGAIDEPADGEFIVELEADGDAEVRVVSRFDLDDDERTAFERLDDNDERTAAAEQFLDEMRFVAEVANDNIDREMNVSNVSVETETQNGIGVVTYTVDWANLAAVEAGGDRLTISEPFSIYNELDRELVVIAPDGYEITSATPEPEEADERSASWPGLTDLSEFEVVTERTDAEGTDDDGAGFGVVAGVVALLVAVALFARRR